MNTISQYLVILVVYFPFSKFREEKSKESFLLQESYDDLIENNFSPDGIFSVGLKMLHFYSKKNFVIRPAQLLNVVDFSDYPPEVRQIYCMMKYLKQALRADIKSYLMKKVVLRREFIAEIIKGGEIADHLYDAMTYHQVKKAFQLIIDYEEWKNLRDQRKDDGIPLFPRDDLD